jgi:hypothetical protein
VRKILSGEVKDSKLIAGDEDENEGFECLAV